METLLPGSETEFAFSDGRRQGLFLKAIRTVVSAEPKFFAKETLDPIQ
jgi:hypothetical protein